MRGGGSEKERKSEWSTNASICLEFIDFISFFCGHLFFFGDRLFALCGEIKTNKDHSLN